MQNKGNHSIKRYRTYIGMHSLGRTLGLKKRFGGLHRTYYALFKGKAKGRNWKGSRWIRAEQTQENGEGRMNEAHYIYAESLSVQLSGTA